MNFILKQKEKEVSISKDIVQQLILLLDKVDCTCIWSERDKQYIKINDIPKNLVNELIFKLNTNKLND